MKKDTNRVINLNYIKLEKEEEIKIKKNWEVTKELKKGHEVEYNFNKRREKKNKNKKMK